MQLGDTETTRQIDALQDFASSPALAQLREQADAAKSASAELDFLDLLGVYWREEVHSNFLGWLLNPAQTHGTGDYFLKNFLLSTVAQAESRGIGIATRTGIENADWSATTVCLERNYIDILLVNRSNGFACAIENKIFSPEGIDSNGYSQLTWYREVLERDYPKFTRHHVFLSPQGTLPAQDKERGFWIPENYTTVRQLVEQTLASNADSIGEDVRVFLHQYATTLRRKIVPVPSDVQQRAREIYLQNRDVMELIYRHKPNYQDDAKKIIAAALEDSGDWRVDWALNYYNYLRFLPTAWDEFAELLETGNGWSGSKAMLRFDLYLGAVGEGAGSARQGLALWPGDVPAVRERIVASVNDSSAIFNRAPVDFQDGSLTLDTREYALDDGDLDNWDSEATRAKVAGWVEDFARNEFPAMNEVIINCLREYKAEQDQLPGQ